MSVDYFSSLIWDDTNNLTFFINVFASTAGEFEIGYDPSNYPTNTATLRGDVYFTNTSNRRGIDGSTTRCATNALVFAQGEESFIGWRYNYPIFQIDYRGELGGGDLDFDKYSHSISIQAVAPEGCGICDIRLKLNTNTTDENA